MAADLGPTQMPAGAAESAWAPYLRAISARRMLVLATTLVAFFGCLAWLAQRPATYEATAEVLVTPLPAGDETYQGLPFLRDFGDATRAIQTAATLVDSPAATELAAKRLKQGWTAPGVKSAIKVEPQGESNVLAITAKAETGEESARVANTFARAALDARREALRRAVVSQLGRLSRQQERVTQDGRGEAAADLAQRISALEGVRDGNDPTLSFSERAAVPTAAIGTPKPILAVLALLAGFAFGSGLALLLETADRRIRTEEELLSILPAPVLARVPVLPRSLRRGGLTPADMPPGLREAFRTVRVQLERRPGEHRIVMLTSASAGDGKTTASVSLALSLVAGGHRVLLIDFDLRKPGVASVLGMNPSRTLVATLTGTPLSDLVTSVPQVPPLLFVPAAGADGDVALLESLRRRMPAILAEARELADFIVLDTAPLGEVSDALMIGDKADDIIVVGRPGHTNRSNLQAVRDLLDSAGLTPTGLLILGERSGRPQAYHTYGTQTGSGGSRPRAMAQ